MTTGLRSDASGTFGALTFGGDDAVTFDATGIQAGSYKAGSIDSAALADGVMIENAPVGIGYGPGAGGTVTQATSKSTAVTLNKPTGAITMHNASLAAGAAVGFTLNNTIIDSFHSVGIEQVTSHTPAAYNVWVDSKGVGAVFIVVKNISGAPLSEPIVLSFSIIKGAVA